MDEEVRINEAIKATEVRVVGVNGENHGVLPIKKAIELARAANLDLIEVSGKAIPPVTKISDYGKYKYELKKKNKEIKSKAHVTETKEMQVKIGTGDRDMEVKSKKVAEWLKDGDRVKIDLFLWGRYKFMDFEFLKTRLERFLAIIPESFKIAEPIQKGPKGLLTVIEFDKTGKKPIFASLGNDAETPVKKD
ncbi:MAG: translation initiation factor IF-3 [Minisyncoccia bacterium]